MAIGVSAGTTTYALARRLVDIPGLTVVTNSVPVADVLYQAGRSDQTIILTGGVRTPSDALVGPFAVTALRTIHVDLVFMGVHGMDPRAGFTTPNILEAETDRALVDIGPAARRRRRPQQVGSHRDQHDRQARRGGRAHHGHRAQRRGSRACGCPSGRSSWRGPRVAGHRRHRVARGRGDAACGSIGRRDRPSGRRVARPAPHEPVHRRVARLSRRPAPPLRPARRPVGARLGRSDARPWQGREEPPPADGRPPYDPACYLCPGNIRANGDRNPDYADDVRLHERLRRAPPGRRPTSASTTGCSVAEAEAGTCRVRVLLAAPRPDPGARWTPARSARSSTSGPTRPPSSGERYRWVQVFENRGEAMGASNPHPHGQIWAGSALPHERRARGRDAAGAPGATGAACCSTTSPRSAAARVS